MSRLDVSSKMLTFVASYDPRRGDGRLVSACKLMRNAPFKVGVVFTAALEFALHTALKFVVYPFSTGVFETMSKTAFDARETIFDALAAIPTARAPEDEAPTGPKSFRDRIDRAIESVSSMDPATKALFVVGALVTAAILYNYFNKAPVTTPSIIDQSIGAIYPEKPDPALLQAYAPPPVKNPTTTASHQTMSNATTTCPIPFAANNPSLNYNSGYSDQGVTPPQSVPTSLKEAFPVHPIPAPTPPFTPPTILGKKIEEPMPPNNSYRAQLRTRLVHYIEPQFLDMLRATRSICQHAAQWASNWFKLPEC